MSAPADPILHCDEHGVDYRRRCPLCDAMEDPRRRSSGETVSNRAAAVLAQKSARRRQPAPKVVTPPAREERDAREIGRLQFVDDLPGRLRERFETPFLDEMRANPGRWALLPKPAQHSDTTALRKRNPGFEFAVRGKRLYGRFVGDS